MKQLNNLHNLRILAVLLICFGPLTSHAETLSSYLPEGCYHTGQYKQSKTVKDMTKPLVTEGSFAFNCHHGLIWHTQLPIIETVIYKTQGDNLVLKDDLVLPKADNRIYRALGKLLNNLIGGNDDYLQQNFTITEQVESVILTPKNKQMQKFLRKLTISKRENSLNIHLDIADQQTQDIEIFSQRRLDSFEQHQCEQLVDISQAACRLLFDGPKS